MLLLWTGCEENLMGYNDIVCKFALYTFDLCDQSANEELVLKNNKLCKTFVYICLLYVQDENQDI